MDMFDNVWGDNSEVVVDHCVDITLPVRFLCLRCCPSPSPDTSTDCPLCDRRRRYKSIPRSNCDSLTTAELGFGRRVAWTSDLVNPPGHQMTFKDALYILSTNLTLKFALPDWAMNLTKHTRKVHIAFMELKVCYSESS